MNKSDAAVVVVPLLLESPRRADGSREPLDS